MFSHILEHSRRKTYGSVPLFTDLSTLPPKEVKANNELYILIPTQKLNSFFPPLRLSSFASKACGSFKRGRSTMPLEQHRLNFDFSPL